jgi:shikimate dehydrogenase
VNWRVGVVGSPIAHSLSPQLQEAGLRLAGLAGTSNRVEVKLEDADDLRDLLGAQFDALSVTSPLKGAAFAMSEVRSDAAERTKSVNSLLVRDGLLHGASTDGDGFVASLRDAYGPVVDNAHVVVLGAGGAASAIVDALVYHGAASVAVLGRTQSKVEALADRFPNVFSSALVYRPVDLVINTVPIAGRVAEASVLQGVHPETIAVDITYEPRMSEWRLRYEEAGCRTMNGLAMLAFQAAIQMEWWWGVTLEGAQLLEVLL